MYWRASGRSRAMVAMYCWTVSAGRTPLMEKTARRMPSSCAPSRRESSSSVSARARAAGGRSDGAATRARVVARRCLREGRDEAGREGRDEAGREGRDEEGAEEGVGEGRGGG
jgi:hypothetical protein